jgi:hypothetical protein
MASGVHNAHKKALLDHAHGGPDYVRPATIDIALVTARGTVVQANAGTNFTEASYTGYARVSVDNSDPSSIWGAASNSDPSVKANTAEIDFGVAGAGANQTVTGFRIFEGGTNNPMRWGDLTMAKTITEGDPVKIPVGALTLSSQSVG